ncbi:MAG: hypothetical protein HYZ14_05045 [Bacteroidetes bacterium]|nr:hypothetical protein [Bacteroidota bacterium]
MKQFFILIYLTVGFAFAQNDLVNTYSSYSEVYGGMEDSGIQRTESYIFVANSTLKIPAIKFEENGITLQKGDTLLVAVNSFKPYTNSTVLPDSVTVVQSVTPRVTENFTAIKYGTIYFVQVNYPAFWNGEIEYHKQKKKYTAKIKTGFDAGNTEYAP